MAELWHRQPVAVLGSGPSLTKEQIALIKRANIPTIAVNTTWEKARFCNVIYAGDHDWWKWNHEKIDIDAERWSCSDNGMIRRWGVRHRPRDLKPSWNSGLLAIGFAIARGARPIILVGFDFSVKNGIHHHGPHPKTTNPNEKKCLNWIHQARSLRAKFPKAVVYNCSTESAMDAWPRKNLTDVLCSLNLI